MIIEEDSAMHKYKNSRHVIYVGFVIPKEIALRHLNSFAGNEAEINFIANVLDEYNTYVCSYSYNLFMGNRFLYAKACKANIKECDFAEYYGISVLNFPILKRINSLFQISRYLTKTIQEIFEIDKNADIRIITCNSYPLFSLPALKIANKYNIETISYLIDGFYYQSKLNILRRLNETIAKRNLKNYDKVIALSENVLNDFCATHQTQIAITPIQYEEKDENYKCQYFDKTKFNIVFAGGIAPLNGIDLYCEVSKDLRNGFRFHLFGRGEIADKLIAFVNENQNIYYHGVVNHDELMQIEKHASALIIMRPTVEDKQNNITKYGIPFKLIEYLQSGVPIIASPMNAIPNYLNQFINFCPADKDSILDKINEIATNYDVYLKKADSARAFMKSNCSWENYGRTLKSFIYDKQF